MQTQLTPAEIIARGEALYAEHLRETGEAAQSGAFIMLDLLSNDYEIGREDEEFELSRRLRQRHPNGEFYFVRIGSRGTYSLGGTL